MVVIGIVGGVASGKSLVASQFQQLGAVVLDADRIGHEILLDDKVKQALRSRWGDGVFNTQQEIDRKAVANIVFAVGPDGLREREFLEQITHPKIRERLQQHIEELTTQGDIRAVVLDVALLFEGGWDQYCGIIVFVDASAEVRLERAKNRGWSEAEFAAREEVQLSLAEKQHRSGVMIENSGSKQETLQQVRQCWKSLT